MSLSVTVLKVSFKDLFIISTEQGIRSNKENYRINFGIETVARLFTTEKIKKRKIDLFSVSTTLNFRNLCFELPILIFPTIKTRAERRRRRKKSNRIKNLTTALSHTAIKSSPTVLISVIGA